VEFAEAGARVGYTEGENIEFVWRFGDGRFERLPALATELVELEVDVIVPATPPAIRAAKLAAGTVPIVFPLGSDPVETGLVSSLDRPGRNITGMATMSREQSEPRMAFVRQLMPAARHIALMRHSPNAALDLQVDASRQAAPEQGFEIVVLDFATAEEIEQAFKTAAEQRVQAMLPLSDPMALANAKSIAALSLQYGFRSSHHSAKSPKPEAY
jgi:ABC-type uncharacterized transport system substrate-binding protein